MDGWMGGWMGGLLYSLVVILMAVRRVFGYGVTLPYCFEAVLHTLIFRAPSLLAWSSRRTHLRHTHRSLSLATRHICYCEVCG